ncbi:hypothetical protein DTL42_09785 [Bremerella cremea]|uniref:Uncharacterized protein n=1 Tax=Bremerella cremea TaxID=1031537 RepID=A0A368KS78_9BACT|nr:hypothetical protein [Bremerella cremea]RCS51842.1 hypothetical protein DTL42_09785 [Bremerella cremea]
MAIQFDRDGLGRIRYRGTGLSECSRIEEKRYQVLEMPYAVVEWVERYVIFPPLPPYVEDDEEVSRPQTCPRCWRLIVVSDPGFSYCTNCFGVLCVTDALEILQVTPHPFHCPDCHGALEEKDCESTGDGYVFCHLCGCLFIGSDVQPDGVQLVGPGEDEFWPY